MDISLSKELQLLSQELYRHLSPQTLEKVAKDTDFVRQTSVSMAGKILLGIIMCLAQSRCRICPSQ